MTLPLPPSLLTPTPTLPVIGPSFAGPFTWPTHLFVFSFSLAVIVAWIPQDLSESLICPFCPAVFRFFKITPSQNDLIIFFSSPAMLGFFKISWALLSASALSRPSDFPTWRSVPSYWFSCWSMTYSLSSSRLFSRQATRVLWCKLLQVRLNPGQI